MFGYACDRCREKHQSCNHELPCKRCIKANVADTCHYTPKRTRSKNMMMSTSGPSLRHAAPGSAMPSSDGTPRNTLPPSLIGTGPPMYPMDGSSMVFYAGLPGQGGPRAGGLSHHHPHHPHHPSHFPSLPHHLSFAHPHHPSPPPPPLMFPFDPKMGGMPPPPSSFFSPQGGPSFMPSAPHPMMMMMPHFPPPQYPPHLPMMPQFEPRRSMTPSGNAFPSRQPPPPPPFYLPSDMLMMTATPPFQRKSNSALSEAMLFGNGNNIEPPALPPPEELLAPPPPPPSFPLPGFNHSYTFPETQGGIPPVVSSSGSSGSIHDSIDGQGMMSSGVHVQEYIRDALAMIHDDEKGGNDGENRDQNTNQKIISKMTTSETSSMSRLLNSE